MRYRILRQKIFNAGKEFKDFQNKLRTDLVETMMQCMWKEKTRIVFG